MGTLHRAIGQPVTIHFANGETREVSNGNVYLYESGILKIVADGKTECHLPHTVNQVIFPDSEKTDKPKRPRVMMG